MSTQINQYFMYGILVPYKWRNEWMERTGKQFYDTFEEFMDDSAFDNKIKGKDGIFCISEGRSGGFIIIGRVLDKSKDGEYLGSGKPIEVPELSEYDKKLTEAAVEKHFGLKGKFNFYFVTYYR
jgi:hypothetical protein